MSDERLTGGLYLRKYLFRLSPPDVRPIVLATVVLWLASLLGQWAVDRLFSYAAPDPWYGSVTGGLTFLAVSFSLILFPVWFSAMPSDRPRKFNRMIVAVTVVSLGISFSYGQHNGGVLRHAVQVSAFGVMYLVVLLLLGIKTQRAGSRAAVVY